MAEPERATVCIQPVCRCAHSIDTACNRHHIARKLEKLFKDNKATIWLLAGSFVPGTQAVQQPKMGGQPGMTTPVMQHGILPPGYGDATASTYGVKCCCTCFSCLPRCPDKQCELLPYTCTGGYGCPPPPGGYGDYGAAAGGYNQMGGFGHPVIIASATV